MGYEKGKKGACVCVERGRWVEGESRVAEVISAGELFGGVFHVLCRAGGNVAEMDVLPILPKSTNLPIQSRCDGVDILSIQMMDGTPRPLRIRLG